MATFRVRSFPERAQCWCEWTSGGGWMSWQDDLGELDPALADGTISADVYRRRRDEILAAAASSPSRATPDDQPTSRAQGPFAPPFRWTSTSPDTTQVGPGADDT